MIINASLVQIHTLKMAINPSDKRNITAITAKYRIRSNVVEILAHMLGIPISVNKVETFPLKVESISGEILLRFNCQIPIIDIEQLIRIIDSKLKFPENYTRYMLKTIDRTSIPPTSEFITESCMATVSHENQRYTPRRAGPFRGARAHSAPRGPIGLHFFSESYPTTCGSIPRRAGPLVYIFFQNRIPQHAGPFRGARAHWSTCGNIYCKKRQNRIPQHAGPLLQKNAESYPVTCGSITAKKGRIVSRNMRKYLCTHPAGYILSLMRSLLKYITEYQARFVR